MELNQLHASVTKLAKSFEIPEDLNNSLGFLNLTVETAQALKDFYLSGTYATDYSAGAGGPIGNIFPLYFGYPPDIRKVIYTANAIESLNRVLWDVINQHKIFPSGEFVKKILA